MATFDKARCYCLGGKIEVATMAKCFSKIICKLTAFEIGISKLRVSADFVSGEASLYFEASPF